MFLLLQSNLLSSRADFPSKTSHFHFVPCTPIEPVVPLSTDAATNVWLLSLNSSAPSLPWQLFKTSEIGVSCVGGAFWVFLMELALASTQFCKMNSTELCKFDGVYVGNNIDQITNLTGSMSIAWHKKISKSCWISLKVSLTQHSVSHSGLSASSGKFKRMRREIQRHVSLLPLLLYNWQFRGILLLNPEVA